MLRFNSIKVRLRQDSVNCGLLIISFQFHKGSIKTKCMEREATTPYRFNSIKVRLRQPSLVISKGTNLFQFHKGSIKTQAITDNVGNMNAFQFHKGSIKTIGFIEAILKR